MFCYFLFGGTVQDCWHTWLTYRYGHNRATPVSSLIQQRPLAVWAYSSGCSLRGPHTCATSIHRSPPWWLAPPKRPTSSVLASNNRERSQTAQPWTSLCNAASNGSSFLATHRGNGYALRACHQMMMNLDIINCLLIIFIYHSIW